MNKTIRRITDLEEHQAETYRYWQSVSLGERLSAVCEASIDGYAFRGSASMLAKDLKDFLCAFNAHNVKYLVVGAYAVGVHAEPQATKDLDVLIGTTQQNAEAVFVALTDDLADVEKIRAAGRVAGST